MSRRGNFWLQLRLSNSPIMSQHSFQNPIGKFFGSCNRIDKLLIRCLKKERQQNQSDNLKRSAERQKQMQERISRDRIEENSQ